MSNNNIELLNLSYEETPDTFAKRCINCYKLIYIRKSSIDDIVTCPNCKINMKAEINIAKSIKLKKVNIKDFLTRQELAELNASQEDTDSPPRWY